MEQGTDGSVEIWEIPRKLFYSFKKKSLCLRRNEISPLLDRSWYGRARKSFPISLRSIVRWQHVSGCENGICAQYFLHATSAKAAPTPSGVRCLHVSRGSKLPQSLAKYLWRHAIEAFKLELGISSTPKKLYIHPFSEQ
jgi:hypothetical protein